MPNRNARGGGDGPDGSPSYPVLTNQPGVELVDPVRRARLVAVLFALSIVLASTGGAYVSTTLASEKTARSNAATLAEMNRRTAARLAENARLSRALEQYRRDMCSVVLDHPRTPKMAEIIDRYQCDIPYEPAVPREWKPAPRPSGDIPVPSQSSAPATPQPSPTR